MTAGRSGEEAPAWGGSPVPSLAGLDGTYLQRMDLSPMIAVLFTVLVIYMVLTPAVTTCWWTSPRALTASVIPRDRVTLFIDQRGRFYLPAGGEVSSAQLSSALRPLLRGSVEPDLLYVTADDGVRYSSVLDAMQAARSAGVRHVGLTAELPHGWAKLREAERARYRR